MTVLYFALGLAVLYLITELAFRKPPKTSGFNVADLHLSIPQAPRGAGLFVIPLLEARKGIIIDMEENRERPLKGVVVAVSTGGTAPETGRPVQILSKVGDLVDFGKYAGLAYQLEGPGGTVKAYIMRDSEILASQPAGSYDLTIHEDNPAKMHLAGLTCEHCPRETGEEGLNKLREVAGWTPDTTAAKETEPAPHLVITG